MSAPAKPLPWPWPLWQRLALLLIALGLSYELLPTLDLAISGLVYRVGPDGFWLRNTWPALAVYWGTRVMTAAIAIALLVAIVRGFIGDDASHRDFARRAAVVLLMMALGPGLIVHEGFKNHWGRPRPAQIENFGGAGHYVAPGLFSDQCARNCSFVSAHAAAGYVLMAGGLLWPAQRRRWLAIGLAAGSLIGAVRIVQGGHFFSDVLGALAVVAASNGLIEWLARRLGWLGAAPR